MGGSVSSARPCCHCVSHGSCHEDHEGNESYEEESHEDRPGCRCHGSCHEDHEGGDEEGRHEESGDEEVKAFEPSPLGSSGEAVVAAGFKGGLGGGFFDD